MFDFRQRSCAPPRLICLPICLAVLLVNAAMAQPLQWSVRGAADAAPSWTDHDEAALRGRLRGEFALWQDHDLAQALRARVAAGLHPDVGGRRLLCRSNDCEPAPPLRASASGTLSHYAFGRLSIGWQPSLPGAVAALGNAWGAEPPGVDGCAALLRCPARQFRLGLTGESATYEFRTLAGQLLGGDQGGVDVALLVSHARGGNALSLGWVRKEGGEWMLPLAAVTHVGRWRVFGAAATSGPERTRGWHTSLSGATPAAGGEFRLGAWRYRLATEPPLNKIAAGWHAPITTRARWGFDVAAARSADGRRWVGATLGTEWSWP